MHRYLFYLLLVFLPTQLGRHFWPDWALVLGRRIDYLSPTLYLTDILIVLVLLFWLIEIISRNRYHIVGKNSLLRNTRYVLPVLGFMALNIWFAASPPVAVYKWVKVLEYALLVLYIVKTKPRWSLIVAVTSLTVIYASLVAIIQFALQHSIGGLLWFLGERTFTIDTPGIARINLCQSINARMCHEFLRPYATFPHPNVLGGFLAAMLPIVILQEKTFRSPSVKKLSFVFKAKLWAQRTTVVLGVIALFLTFSRSAWVTGIAGICITYYVFWNKQKKRLSSSIIHKLMPIILLSLVFIGICVLLPLSVDSESVVVRQQLNVAAVNIWQQSTWLGVGLGNFLVKLPSVLPSRQIYFLQPVHNIYLLLLSEIGVLGVGMILLFIIRVIRKNQNSLLMTYHISLVILLLLGLVDHYPLTLQQGQLLLVLLLALV